MLGYSQKSNAYISKYIRSYRAMVERMRDFIYLILFSFFSSCLWKIACANFSSVIRQISVTCDFVEIFDVVSERIHFLPLHEFTTEKLSHRFTFSYFATDWANDAYHHLTGEKKNISSIITKQKHLRGQLAHSAHCIKYP